MTQNNSMESSFPTFFTSNYFQKILNKHFGSSNNLQVIDVQISPCNGTGEGFLSTLFRISVKFTQNNSKIVQKVSLITKGECTNEFSLEKVGENGFDVQNKEIKFFKNIAPKMLKVFGQNSAKIFPNVIEIDEENKILIFEDLQDLNYKMNDRMNGINEAHAKMALEKFAKFHVATLKVHNDDPEAFKNYQCGMFGREFNEFDFALIYLFESAVDEISTWDGCEEYARKMSKMKETAIEKLKKCFDVNLNEFNVLNHGDLWTTNLMFQYNGDDEELPNELVLIDFQFCHFGSPALDLIRFFFTSLNDELYDTEHIQKLLKFYYTELTKNLKDFDCKILNFPDFEQFVAEFNSKLHFALMYTFCVLPVMTTDDPDNDFIAHHMNDERSKAFRRRVMKAERYKKIVTKMLPFYDEMGLI